MRRFLAAGIIAGLLALLVGGLAWFFSPSPERTGAGEAGATPSLAADAVDARTNTPLRLVWTEGARAAFRVHVVSSAKIHLGDRSPLAIRQEIDGRLHLRVYRVTDESIVVGLQLKPLSVLSAGQPAPDAVEILSTPFIAHVTHDGQFENFRFPEGLPADGTRIVEELLRLFQVVVPGDSRGSWIREEEHATGVYVASYEAKGRDVEKRKTAYRSFHGAGTLAGPGADARAEIGASLLRATISREVWLDGGQVAEEVTVRSDTKVFSEAKIRASLERIETPPQRDVELFAGASADDPEALLATAKREPRPERREPPMPGELRALVAELESDSGPSPRAFSRLRQLLELDPMLAVEVERLLRDGGLRDATMEKLLGALGMSGTPESQRVLSAVLEDASFQHLDRLRAAVALGDAQDPTQSTLDALWRGFEDRHANGSESIDLSNTAALSLGRITRHLSETHADRSLELLGELYGRLAGASDDPERAILLKALGNAGSIASVPEAAEHLRSGAPSVRAAAAKALGQLRSPDAVDHLAARLSSEDDGRVRTAIAAALRRSPVHSEAALGTARSLVRDEPDEPARYELVRFLSERTEGKERATTLSMLLAREPSRRIREFLLGELAVAAGDRTP